MLRLEAKKKKFIEKSLENIFNRKLSILILGNQFCFEISRIIISSDIYF